MLGWLVLASGYAILVCCDSVVSQSSVPEINAELCVVNPCAGRLPISEERNISTCTVGKEYLACLSNCMHRSLPAAHVLAVWKPIHEKYCATIGGEKAYRELTETIRRLLATAPTDGECYRNYTAGQMSSCEMMDKCYEPFLRTFTGASDEAKRLHVVLYKAILYESISEYKEVPCRCKAWFSQEVVTTTVANDVSTNSQSLEGSNMRCIEDCVVQRVGGIEKIETLRSMFIGLVGRRARRQASSLDTLNVTVLCGSEALLDTCLLTCPTNPLDRVVAQRLTIVAKYCGANVSESSAASMFWKHTLLVFNDNSHYFSRLEQLCPKFGPSSQMSTRATCSAFVTYLLEHITSAKQKYSEDAVIYAVNTMQVMVATALLNETSYSCPVLFEPYRL